jgi:nudix-type nucleoside diphosphatase (YffH/AdpP family)
MKKSPQTRVLSLQDDPVSTGWAVFHRASAQVLERDGVIRPYHRDFLERGNAIALLAYCAIRSSLLLVKQFRLPVYMNNAEDSWLLEACGGMVHGSGSSVETAHAEALEELGVPVSNLKKVFQGYASPGSLTEKIDYYLGEYAADAVIPAHAGHHVEGEWTEVIEMSIDEALGHIASGEIQDTRTIALIYCLIYRLQAGV